MILLERMSELARSQRPMPWEPAQTTHFQNIAYRPSMVPLLVDAHAIGRLVPVVEAYVAALNHTLARYVNEPWVRDWFGLEKGAEELVCAEGEARARVRVCRLDGYVSGGRLRILENNADAPAGTLFTPRLNEYVASWTAYPVEARLPMEAGEQPFLELLAGSDPPPDQQRVIRVLQPCGAGNRESGEVAAALRHLGYDSRVMDPRDLLAGGERFIDAGRPVDVIWNKINTSTWNALFAGAPGLLDGWARTLAAGQTLHLNGFASRFVAETKRCHAWLSSEEGRQGMPPSLSAAVESLVVPTVRLRDTSVPDWLGYGPDVSTIALRERASLVLKVPYDIRGDGVTVGRAVDAGAWSRRVAEVRRQDGVVQQYVEPTEVPVVTDVLAMMNSSLDWFVIDGRVVGLGSKASSGPLVNLFQGGTKLAVFQELRS